MKARAFSGQNVLSLGVPCSAEAHPSLSTTCRDSDSYSLEFLNPIVFKLPLLFVKDTDF